MKKISFLVNMFALTLWFLLVCIGCKKDSTENRAAKAGTWSGTNISFTVGGNPLKVSELEFTYNPHSSDVHCSFNYESGASFATVAEIEGKGFTADINTFSVNGTFPTDTTATIEIDWTIYVTECDSNVTGSNSYTAAYHSL